MKSAEAWVLRASPSLPSKDQVTSPLPYQSNSGPTPSPSSAMNPSRETAAPMSVLPKSRPSRKRSAKVKPALKGRPQQRPRGGAHQLDRLLAREAGDVGQPDVGLDAHGRADGQHEAAQVVI